MKRYLSDKEEEIVLEQVKLIANMHNIPITAIIVIINRSRNYLNNYLMPEDKKDKRKILTPETRDYIKSIPNFETYRICTLRDMVLEKFPNYNANPMKLYKGIYSFINGKRYAEISKEWHKNNKDKVSATNKKYYEKRKQIYYEEKRKQ